jgi:hypothetical protein
MFDRKKCNQDGGPILQWALPSLVPHHEQHNPNDWSPLKVALHLTLPITFLKKIKLQLRRLIDFLK